MVNGRPENDQIDDKGNRKSDRPRLKIDLDPSERPVEYRPCAQPDDQARRFFAGVGTDGPPRGDPGTPTSAKCD